MSEKKKLSVLIAEDDPDDQFLFRSAVIDAYKHVDLHIVATGQQLISYLLQKAVYAEKADNSKPDLILADLRTPFFNLSNIRELRIYSQFKNIPLYVFSINADRDEASSVIEAGGSGFYLKPATYHQLKSVIKEILKKTGLTSS